MNFRRTMLLSLAAIISLTVLPQAIGAQEAQTGKLYQQMSQTERTAFVAEQARRISREMSGTEYEFTPAFEAEIQKFVDKYARRINNNAGDRPGKGDARFIFERGQTNAPVLINAFKAQGVSPLIGLYLPLIESEYRNLQEPNSAGARGMFQFLSKTGQRYGLTEQELLNVEKSADAAARYIADGLKQFKDDPMKEALALLSYNRGRQQTAQALQLALDEQNKRCSICALTAASSRLDQTFQNENVYYVPLFFAAA
ncbi:MAG TPA: transglycosylase SLT domain-containing protein, partial [Pyrinomonadaceae bacterium]